MKKKTNKFVRAIRLFLYALVDWFVPSQRGRVGVLMRSEEGEFTVVGNDKLDIVLTGEPNEVSLELVEDQVLIPCDPHNNNYEHGNQVSWYVKHYHRDPQFRNNYVLRVEWNVVGIRRIKWVVKY